MPDSDRWIALLDDLERPLAAAGALPKPSVWRPPAGLGPLPAELRDRAEALLVAHAEAIAALESEQNTTARHLAALRAVPPGRVGSMPVYLDTNG